MCYSNLLLSAAAESERVCSDIVTVLQDPVMKLSVHDVFLYLEVESNLLLKMSAESKVYHAHMFHSKGRISAVILVEVTSVTHQSTHTVVL